MSSKTILLHSPDVNNRTLARCILSRNGFRVLEAINPHHAEMICRQAGSQIDLIITNTGDYPLCEHCQRRPDLLLMALPARFPGAEEFLEKVRSILESKIKKASILVVDDDQGWANMVSELLTHHGYEAAAARGTDARQMFSSANPDVLLTEIVMEGAEGLQLIKDLLRKNRGLKVIAMSGSSRAGTYLRTAKLLGAQAVLAKPVSAERILEVISQLCDSPGIRNCE